jgi:hypothetical protein
MKCKGHDNITYSYPFISLLNDDSLELLNSVCHTHYSKSKITSPIIIKRKGESFEFWNKFMRNNKGQTNPNI